MVEFLQALQNVIDYMWKDEEQSWEDSGKPDNHIFTHLQTIDKFLKEVYQWVDEK